MSIVFMCDLYMRGHFEPFVALINTLLFHNFSPMSLVEHCTSVTCIVS